jgi:hypothetical protein
MLVAVVTEFVMCISGCAGIDPLAKLGQSCAQTGVIIYEVINAISRIPNAAFPHRFRI